MPTMNVSLPAEMVEFVEAELADGGYSSASEVVREALRLLRRERAAEVERMTILRREIDRGLEQAATGRLSRRTIDDIATAVAREHSRP